MPACSKICYPTARVAARALFHVQKIKRAQGGRSPVAVHPCTECRQWHITSKRAVGKLSRHWQVLAGLPGNGH